MAGIYTQTVAFNSAFTTIGMANDLQKGIIDRFRSLPMSRVAVILGPDQLRPGRSTRWAWS